MAENRKQGNQGKQAGKDSSHPESRQGQSDEVTQANESGEPRRSGRGSGGKPVDQQQGSGGGGRGAKGKK
jgi:hypothetical protein